jgi:hypothetical protein
MGDKDLPLSLKAIPTAVDITQLVSASRVVCTLFPRRILRRVIGAACRFYDIDLNNSPQHTHDVIFTSLVMRTLQASEFVSKYVERAFVDDRSPSAVALVIILKNTHDGNVLSVSKVADELFDIVKANHVTIMGQPSDPPVPPNGGQQGFKKRRTLGTKDQQTANLKLAHLLVKRPAVPVHRIAALPPFSTSVLSWGQLVTLPCELQNVLVDVGRSRLLDLGTPCIGFAFGHPVAARAGASAVAQMDVDISDSDTDAPATADDQENTPETDRYTVSYTLAGAGTETFDMSPEKLLCISHPLVQRFLAADLRAGTIPAATGGVWELEVPAVDLPHLHERYLANSQVYDRFSLFADNIRARKDVLEANPRGDLSILSSFFSENPEMRDADRVAAARLSFDIMTRPDGRLPKAWAESMAVLVDMLNKNNSILPPGSLVCVKEFRNLTFSGNYALYLLQQFELMGTFNFHIDQFITTLVLDGVAFRPRHEDDDDDQSNVGMCANILNYGPPGIGKSTASMFFLTAYKFTYVTNTYSSMRSIYSNLPCSDFLNGKASYNDEAPPWIPESSHKSAPQERDLIAHLKERLSSGRMNGERLVRDDAKGVHKTVMFNVDVQNAPMVMNTNAPERSGHPPLLERFIPRYYMFGNRAVPHSLVTGAPPLAPEVKRSIRREFAMQRILVMMASKLQTDGVISFPCSLVFKSFYGLFLARMRLNPWLDCDPPTAGDRRSSIIEMLYSFYVNRLVIHRVFLEPGGQHFGKPFAIDQMLDMQPEMASGDVQSAILAIGAYSHSMRSPTEYRVAELMKTAILTKLRREFRKEAEKNDENSSHYSNEPTDATAFSPHQELLLGELVGDTDAERAVKFLGDGGLDDWQALPKPRRRLGSRYVPVLDSFWGSGTPSLWEACSALAHCLLEGQSSNVHKVMLEHAQKRLHLLATVSARCGPDEGFTPLLLHMDSGSRRTRVLVLSTWITEATVTHDHSVHNMLKDAAFACSYMSPGTFLTLEPFSMARNAAASEALGRPAEGMVPNMLSSFTVPVHETSCAVYDEAVERSLPRMYNPGIHGFDACTCFRSRHKPAKVGDEEVHVDPHVVALRNFRAKWPGAKPTVSCRAAPLTYPLDRMRQIFAAPQQARGAVRDPDDAEMAILEEFMAEMEAPGN